MKIDAFTHIFPKAYWERMLRVLPDGRDMHKRVRAIPSIVELDARFASWTSSATTIGRCSRSGPRP
jgi:hypothetical protein